MDKILVYGKDSCPYTTAARRDYAARKLPFEYKNIGSDPSALQEMQRYAPGQTRVPIIVENGRVTIGYQGGT